MRIGCLTISDRSFGGDREDESGDVMVEMVQDLGPVSRRLVPDDEPEIRRVLKELVDEEGCRLVLTSGGTGIGPRDVTPEATRAVIQREVPGLAEAMRARSLAETPHAPLSRAVAGTRGRSLVVNLPGSPRGVRTCLEAVLPALMHGVVMLGPEPGDCAGTDLPSPEQSARKKE